MARNHNHAPTTPKTEQNDNEILTMGDFVRSKVSGVMGGISVMMAERKIDRHLQEVAAEDTTGNPARQEQNEAYMSYRDNLVASYVADKKLEREYRKEKAKYVLQRIGSAAMWVPGVDIIGNRIMEAHNAKRVDKDMHRAYIRKNGGFMGTFKTIHNQNKEKHAKQEKILESFSDQVEANRRAWSDLDAPRHQD